LHTCNVQQLTGGIIYLAVGNYFAQYCVSVDHQMEAYVPSITLVIIGVALYLIPYEIFVQKYVKNRIRVEEEVNIY
jgi:uncharacterized membrane protein YoaT (DUF817 family)